MKNLIHRPVGKRLLAHTRQFRMFTIPEQKTITGRRALGIDVISLHSLFVEDGKIIPEREPTPVQNVFHHLRNALVRTKLQRKPQSELLSPI